jgi:hypothetical protein
VLGVFLAVATQALTGQLAVSGAVGGLERGHGTRSEAGLNRHRTQRVDHPRRQRRNAHGIIDAIAELLTSENDDGSHRRRDRHTAQGSAPSGRCGLFGHGFCRDGFRNAQTEIRRVAGLITLQRGADQVLAIPLSLQLTALIVVAIQLAQKATQLQLPGLVIQKR